jgi:hypothetical protein
MQVSRGDQRYRLVDTAGIRKKKSVDYGPEFFGINRSFQSHSPGRCGAAGDRCRGWGDRAGPKAGGAH